MKVLLSWLREFAPIEGDPVALADELSALGMAVEAVDVLGAGLAGVVVARVLSLRPHPQADRIQLVDVDRGDGEALQICCGAFNMAPGDLVPLATLGTTMPSGMRIERRKLRGEWSNGMLCSATELGLGDDHAGILILPGSLEPGTDLRDALGITDDVLYDLDLTGNRPDALSVAGVARDLAAWLKVPFAIPEPDVGEDSSVDGAGAATIEVLAPELCGRFAARLLRDVKVEPSPAWLANRLVALGMRPINNVVDVSNYVMLELGQPSHTFDRARIEGRRLGVRWARDGEQIVTLDGQTRTLGPRDGVIADGRDEAVSIAGVMGGRSTEISDTTSDVLLEMAWWDPMSIARTARRLGLRSEASTRFERGSDPAVIDLALRRFAQLLAPSGARLAAGTIDVAGNLPAPATVRVRTERVNAILGTALSAADIRGHLEPIGFRCAPVDGDHDVTVPTFRMVDSSTEIDVIEEVARHHGYARIAKTVPRPEDQAGGLTSIQWDRRTLRAALVGFGYTEVMPLPFLAPGDLDRAGLGADGIRVTNPLVADESIMRTSLRPGILKTLAYNASHRNLGLSFFEIGHVYLPTDRTAELPDEREHLAIALGGREAPAAVEAWQVVVDALGVAGAGIEVAEPAGMHPGRSARARVGDVAVAVLGEVDPAVLDAYGVPERVAWLEVDLTTLLGLPRGANRYRPISRFPSSDIDLAFEVAEETPAAAVDDALRAAAGPLLADLRLFDVYRGDRVAEGSRSLAYRLRLQSSDHTLTDAEIAEVRSACIAAVEGALPAKLRG
jgi:phenylalanyl-tRNA synthetase beta chain